MREFLLNSDSGPVPELPASVPYGSLFIFEQTPPCTGNFEELQLLFKPFRNVYFNSRLSRVKDTGLSEALVHNGAS